MSRRPPSPRQLISPPDSPGQRRRFLRASDDAEGEMLIESYLNACDPYRSTTLMFAPPLPLTIEPFAIHEDPTQSFHDEIHAVLHNFGLGPYFIVGKASKPEYTGGNDTFNLLHVRMPAKEDGSPLIRLGPLKDAIQQILHQHDIYDIEVEVAFIELSLPPVLSCLLPGDPLVEVYEREKFAIYELVKNAIPNDWQFIVPLFIQRHDAEARSMLVVLVKPWAKADWTTLRYRIIYQLRAFAGGRVDVEFAPGELKPLVGESFMRRFHPTLEMGDSIGVHQGGNVGTLGGFVTLTRSEKTHHGFLTNYHVIRPHNERDGSQLDQFGLSVASPPAREIPIEAFSQSDRDATLSDIDCSLAEWNSRHNDLATREDQYHMSGKMPPAALLDLIGNARDTLRVLSDQKDIVQKMPELLGVVLLASGKSLQNGKLLDWAFVELSPKAEAKHFKPNLMFEIPGSHQASSYIRNQPYTVPAGFPITEFGSLKLGDYGVKLGRSTGLSAGVVNGTKGIYNWKTTSKARYDQHGNSVLDVTEEFLIISKKLAVPNMRAEDFANEGDSGSFVLNQDGVVTGLLYAGYSTGRYVAGIATCMSDVRRAIELKSGGVLGLPQ
ncbi:hypothetical protein N7495_009621 [Penicillium taxi]|uniref:uncharacterized protein n=1 Tax=Penicillium taxi TaxID=168475 RepID=UPI00254568ED|nr:uncharacterized protein N7495_009621 [Penicillium taxi]KAJ5885111.1 hypothetical protein N7495_009621 [Penicillium taxi]